MRRIHQLLITIIVTLSFIGAMTMVGSCYSGWKGHEQYVNLNTTYSSAISSDDVNTDNVNYTEAYVFTVPKDGTITLYIECNNTLNYSYMNYAAYRWYDSGNIDMPLDAWNYYDYAIDPMIFYYSSARGVYYGERSIDLCAGTYYLTVSLRIYANETFPYNFNIKYTEKQTDSPAIQPTEPSDVTNPTIEPVISNENEVTDLPAIKILAPKASKKAATFRWKKVSKKNRKKIAGIQIQYSLDKTFKTGVKTVTAKKTATSKKIKKLKSKKRYYVRVRAYKKVGNVMHVSKWSAKKSVKVR